MRGSSLAWPGSLELLRPFIVTYWSGRTTADMPEEVRRVVDAAGLRQQHLNLALFSLDSDGKLRRALVPRVRPPEFGFDPEAQGRDFQRQLAGMLEDLQVPEVQPREAKLALPEIAGPERPAGLRVYLTFSANRLNHYRTPTVEAVPLTAAMRQALRYPAAARRLQAEDLRPLLAQLYPPAIMDGHGGCRSIDASLTLAPAGADAKGKYALLQGTVAIELDNANRTRYQGPMTLALEYDPGQEKLRSVLGVGSWVFPKHTPQGQVAEQITMTAAIESRPE